MTMIDKTFDSFNNKQLDYFDKLNAEYEEIVKTGGNKQEILKRPKNLKSNIIEISPKVMQMKKKYSPKPIQKLNKIIHKSKPNIKKHTPKSKSKPNIKKHIPKPKQKRSKNKDDRCCVM